jgi:hypothetical protein
MTYLSYVVCAQQRHPERTDWFYNHGYGILVHYLYGGMNTEESIKSLGKSTSWDECVNDFDVELFADHISQTGAGYVIFTVLQRNRYMIAPNETYNHYTGYKTGEACSTRDLIEDLYQALHKRNIDLMLYFTGDGPSNDLQAIRGLGTEPITQTNPINEEFVRRWSEVVADYGKRYGKKVKGYWVDGCYSWIGYNDEMFKILSEGLRAGYKDRIIAFNSGVAMGVHSKYEDYITGEQNAFTSVPENGRFIDGKQWHILSFLGTQRIGYPDAWGSPGITKGKQELAEYIHKVNALGGVVSMDVLVFRDGSMDRSQLELLKPLRGRIADLKNARYAWKEGKATPAYNIAWKKPATLRSNTDINRELFRQWDGSLISLNPVHGNRECVDDWAHTYEVDLLEPITVKRIVVHFSYDWLLGGIEDGFPTDVEIFVTDQVGKELSIGRFTGQKGEKLDVSFAPAEARKIRVRSYKPDGRGQTGSQMKVKEVEAYN